MADIPVKNIELHVVLNGYSAYGKVDIKELIRRIQGFTTISTNNIIGHLPEETPFFLNGPDNPYHRLTETEYKKLMRYYR